jgi:hypothetical protein
MDGGCMTCRAKTVVRGLPDQVGLDEEAFVLSGDHLPCWTIGELAITSSNNFGATPSMPTSWVCSSGFQLTFKRKELARTEVPGQGLLIRRGSGVISTGEGHIADLFWKPRSNKEIDQAPHSVD